MAQEPHPQILERRTYEEIIQKHYSPIVSLLDEVANYGSQLIATSFEASEKKLHDAVVIAVLLKHIVSLLDAISILVAKSAVTASHLPLRAILENSIYIRWILKENTSFRASAFYYWDIKDQLSWARSLKKGTDEHARFTAAVADAPWFKMADIERVKIDQTISILEQKLTAPELVEAHRRYERLRKEKKKTKDWYSLDGVGNLREMAAATEMSALYKVFYAGFSKANHGGPISRHISIHKDKRMLFEPIRNPVDWDQVVRIGLTLSFQTYRTIITHYCPQELERFNKLYLAEWGQRFRAIGKVEQRDGTYHFSFPIFSEDQGPGS